MKQPSDAEFQAAATLRQALREFADRSEKLVHAHDLTAEQYQLLLLIRVAPKEQATIGSLCRALRRGQSAVTQLARRAENGGLIRREISNRDARVRYLKLTEEGQRRLAGAVADLSEERARLLELLGGLGT